MKFLEKDLEQIIFEADNDQLQERGLEIKGKKYRQLRIGNYGIADLVTVDRSFVSEFGANMHVIRITVYELKKENINVSVFLQALSYIKGIEAYLKTRTDFIFDYKIVCVGRNIDTESTYVYLPDFICYDSFSLENYTYSYSIDGLKFEKHENYDLKNKGF